MPSDASAHHVPRRLDIQGLRAVAVGLVVLHHVVDHPSGGYIGVDVFFVISGFLITGRLLEPTRRPLHHVLVDFYARRARRILPAALVTLAGTALLARFVVGSERANGVAADAVWSALFAANWHFADIGTDYFGSSQPPSPLQHYWSLAVEEQFYLLWPLLVVAVLVVTGSSRRSSPHRPVLVLSAVIVLSSLAWASYRIDTHPVATYFDTGARAWELGAGAAIAACAGVLDRLRPATREWMAGVGLLGIVAAAVVLTPGSDVPGPAAIAPVAGTCLFLAAGTGATQASRAARVVSRAPLVHLGAISFSVYLWHWPVLVLTTALGLEQGLVRVAIVLATTAVLAELTYRLVERPFLSSSVTRPRITAQRWTAVGVSVAMAAVTAFHTSVTATSGSAAERDDRARPQLTVPGDAGTPESGPSSSADAEGSRGLGQDALLASTLGGHLLEALSTDEFPGLVPDPDRPGDGVPPEMEQRLGCLNPADPTDSSQCTFAEQGSDRLAVVIGDSVSLAWLPGLREALAPRGYAVHAVTFSACPPALVGLTLDSRQTEETCARGLSAALDQIDRLRPDLVIGSSYQLARTQVRPAEGLDQQSTLVDGLVDVAQRVRAAGAEYVLLGPAPAGPSPLTCAGPLQQPADCVTSSRGDYEATLFAFASAAQQADSTFINPQYWFCVDVTCPIFADGILIRWDDVHITDQYSRYVAPLLAASLSPVLAGS